MSKGEFMKELERLLQNIPLEEREQALLYYEDYFADAGEENEQQVIKELESPKKQAESIKADLRETPKKNREGEFTETGFISPKEEREKCQISRNDELEKRNFNKEKQKDNKQQDKQQKTKYRSAAYQETERRENTNSSGNMLLKILLFIPLCIVGIVVGFPLIIVAFSLAITILAILFAIIITIFIITIAFLFSGVVCIGFGFSKLFFYTPVALVILGTGLILFGLGAIFALFTVYLLLVIVPALFRFVISLFRRSSKRSIE